MKLNQIETQNEQSDMSVMTGVDGIKTKLTIGDKIFICKVQLLIDTGSNRGVHMSRLVESLTKVSKANHPSFQIFDMKLLEELSNVHDFTEYLLRLETDYAVERITPASKKETIEVHKCIYKASTMHTTMTVQVNGASACPHARANNPNDYTHIQRSTINLACQIQHINNPNYELSFDDLIEICEKSFSSPVFTLLKSDDEQAVVNKTNTNPLFVEDIARLLHKNSAHLQGDVHFNVINQESIHNHDVIATNVYPFKPPRNTIA